MRVFAGVVDVRPQQSSSVDLSLERRHAWEGDAVAGSYRLKLQGQPTLATAATVTIVAPPGTSIVWTSVPMQVRGNTAVWHGELGGSREFEVRFQKGLLGRMWTRAWKVLSTPVVKL
jgi:hypothetical protein